MGLDVYLYSREEQASNKAHEEGWEKAWNDYHDTETGELLPGKTKEQYDAANAAVPKYCGSANPKSEHYPEHLFNRRYLRSSYNDSGFNHAVPDMLGKKEGGLYWIFEPVIGDNPEPYDTLLDEAMIGALELTKGRALAVAEELRSSDPLRVMHVSAPMLGTEEHMWDHLPTEDEVLAWYREELERRRPQLEALNQSGGEEYGYGTAKGEVFGFTRGLEILAATIGANPMRSFSQQFPPNTVGGQMGVMPQAILVYRQADEAKLSYIQSAEIIAEFCDEAIMLIKQDGSCHMHWSG